MKLIPESINARIIVILLDAECDRSGALVFAEFGQGAKDMDAPLAPISMRAIGTNCTGNANRVFGLE